MLRKTSFLMLILFLIPSISFAKIEIIFSDHKYVMGDNDSKNDARRMCFLEAKRKVLEKAGTYIESHTQVKNYQLTKDEINSYAAVLLKVETVKEKWQLVGENMAIFMTVEAEVDTSSIEKQLAKIKKDMFVQKKIKNQQIQLQKLEKIVINLQKQLGSVDATKAAVLRKERNVTFKQIDILEAKKIEIVEKVKRKSKNAKDLVENGMTMKDVRSLLGSPDGCHRGSLDGYVDHSSYWYYGTATIRFNSGSVVIGVY